MAPTFCNSLTNCCHSGEYQPIPIHSGVTPPLAPILTKLQHAQLLVSEQFADIKNKINQNHSAKDSDTITFSENINKIQEAMKTLPQKDLDNLAWWQRLYERVDTIFNVIHWGASAALAAETCRNSYYKWSEEKEPEAPWFSSITTIAIAAIAVGNSISKALNLQEKISKIKKTLNTVEKTQVMNEHFKEVIDAITKLQERQESHDNALNKALAVLKAHEKNEATKKDNLLRIAPGHKEQINDQLKKEAIEQLGLSREELLMLIIHLLPSTHPLFKAFQDVMNTAQDSLLPEFLNEAPPPTSNQMSRPLTSPREIACHERLKLLEDLAGFRLNNIPIKGMNLSRYSE